MGKNIDNLKNILDVLTGEKNLRERESMLLEEKARAKRVMKEKKLRGVVEGSVKLEDDIVEKKVVQNIKLFNWKAPDRYEYKISNKSFLIIVALSLVFILFLAILGHYYMMAAVIAMLFFLYAVGTSKPSIVEHKITARGIDTGGRLYEWFLLDSFYFTKRSDGRYSLLVDTKLGLPALLILLINEDEKDAIFVLLKEKLLYKDIRKQGRIDRMSYGDYIPLEEV